MNNLKESSQIDSEVMAQVEDFGFYEVDPFDITHDPSYYGLELVVTVTDTRESDQPSIKPDLCFDCALLNLGDHLSDLRDEITRLMNKAADQGNVKVNSALYHICLGIDNFHQSI